jgi:chemotaxis signal transduction protein
VTTPVASSSQPVRACVFTLGDHQLAADIRHTREVVILPDRTPVARAPVHILGVANLRGFIVPIVDVGHLLGLPACPTTETARTVVLEDGGVQLAVPTDEVLGLESFDAVLPVDAGGPSSLAELACGRLQRPDGVATLLDVSRLVEAARVRPPSPPDA